MAGCWYCQKVFRYNMMDGCSPNRRTSYKRYVIRYVIHFRGQRVWVVCNYTPPGNMLGTFRENVRPAKITTKFIDPKKQEDEFIQTCLLIHNQLRARHRVPPLILSPSISSHAMEWAQVHRKPYTCNIYFY